jgi:3-deoxy-7-phosphoheptulonate synthase
MHGNTRVAPNTALKTRYFQDIVTELSNTLQIHKREGSHLGGVHFELTGDPNITECLGGSMELTDISDNYQTLCDPRLNYEQSLDIAFIIAKYLERERTGNPEFVL